LIGRRSSRFVASDSLYLAKNLLIVKRIVVPPGAHGVGHTVNQKLMGAPAIGRSDRSGV
jgi:hypothetical protein